MSKNQSVLKSISLPEPEKGETYAFQRLQTNHPLQQVPGFCVLYPARTRPNGSVLFFNFEFAKLLGLIPPDHFDEMTQELEKEILNTFSLQIENEKDRLSGSGRRYAHGQYMATRYLQIQHRDKKGLHSGDGRSIWNGHIQSVDGELWDISSCGTGATCFSPAVSKQKKYFETGDPSVSYGCGTAETTDFIYTAVLSEILYQRKIPTERTLAVLSYPNGQCIHVRGARSLLRPAHFFAPLKQGDHTRTQALLQHWLARQGKSPQRWLEELAIDFAKAAARFEREYLFVWVEWDGDNFLMDGGILDYGTVRQFGTFQHAYRYDDGDCFSTCLLEQRKKIRNLVCVFHQMSDFLQTGTIKGLSAYRKESTYLRIFDECFETENLSLFLKQFGFSRMQINYLLSMHRGKVTQLKQKFDFFERKLCSLKIHPVGDGINREPQWDMRFFFKQVARWLHEKDVQGLNESDLKSFLRQMSTPWLSKKDQREQVRHCNKLKALLQQFDDVVQEVAKHEKKNRAKALIALMMRASTHEPPFRLTGEALLLISDELFKAYKKKSSLLSQHVMEALIAQQLGKDYRVFLKTPDEKQLFDRFLELIQRNSQDL